MIAIKAIYSCLLVSGNWIFLYTKHLQATEGRCQQWLQALLWQQKNWAWVHFWVSFRFFSYVEKGTGARKAAHGADVRKRPQQWAWADSPIYLPRCSLSSLQEDATLILHVCVIPFFLLNTRQSIWGWDSGWCTEPQVVSGDREDNAGMERGDFGFWGSSYTKAIRAVGVWLLYISWGQRVR